MLNCIIIDDEPLAIKVIEKHLSMMDGFQVLATFESALPVYGFLQNNSVDLVFLDIEMPNLSGFNFLNSLTHKPQVIITTAHRQYALESYEYEIADYLLKPISFERFLKAISKLRKAPIQSASSLQFIPGLEKHKKEEYTFIKVDRRNIRIAYNDILYIESIKNHVKFVLTDSNYITLINLQEIQNRIDPNKFIRVHKSYIIALSKIQSYNGANIQINDHYIPIGRNYKLNFIERLEKNELKNK